MNTARAFAGVAAALTLMTGAFAGTASSSAVAGMAQEVRVREGIGQTLAKLEAGKPVTVAYLGGSITEMNGWRNMTTDWLRKAWPQAKVMEVHAAIGGTGSDLGVFRLGHDVLAKNPDLLFVEFATNDSGKPAEEIWRNFDGIVQQTWAKNPKTDIVFVYTITSQMMADYGEGRMNAAARAMERLAAHYGIPSVCFGPRVVAEVRAGRLVMSLGEVPTAVPKETPDRDRLICDELAKKGRTLFAKDGVHPARPGHALYLASVVAAFEAMRALPPADHVRFLGRPFFDGTLAAAKMVPVTAEMLRGTGWTRLGDGDPVQRSFAARGGQVWRAMRPGDRLRFRFRGTRCAVYDLLGPKGANVRVTVDGKVVRERAPRFDSYCWYTRLATLPVYSGPEGVHEVEIEVLAEQPDRTQVRHEATDTDKYDGTWFQPCQILLVGEMEACQPRAKGWSVATLNGAPGLYRDGKPVAPVLFWQWKIEERDAKAMSRDAGIDLFGVFGSYPHYANPYWKPEGFAGMAYQDENLDQILKWVPSASFLPRLFYSAPDWWIAAHPGERIVYSNFIAPDAEARRSGTLVPRESFASERFRRECGPVYRRAVRHLMDRYGEHLLGIHLTSGPCGEHFAWDVLTQYGDIPLKEAGHGDVSEPMTRHFRDWLRTKYANDPARLKTAWRDDSADFENAQVPSRDDRFALDADGVWRDPAKGRRVADYFACQNGTTVDMLDYFAGIVKDESKGALPTLAFYGYTQDEHWAIECDHRAIAAAYRLPNLDMFSAPHTYNRRMPGEDAMMRCYLASAARHGKLYIDEGDDMTFLEHLKPHPDSRCSATNLFESVNILYREFGQAVTHGTGLWYMDLNGNTFRHPALVEAVGRMRRAADLALERDRSHFSQVAVVSNVESEFYMGYRRTEANNMGLFLYQQQMGAFARAGAPFDWYLADDLDAVQERDYRVVVLLDCQYLTERQRKQIESLKKDRRTIVSFHAPGYVSETGLSRARMEETAGVRMKPKTVRGVLSAIDVATGREWGCGLTRPADGLEDRPRGTRRRPVGAVQRGLFLPDEGAPLMTGVGDLADVTVAVSKEHGGWTSVFSALPALAPDVLRRIYRDAGVHVYTDADVVLSANAAWLMLHTRAKGRYEVRLPRVCKRVVDVTCDRVVATDADRFAYPMEAFQTGVFLLD